VVMSFPPHTIHKLQPTERSLYGPYKKFVNRISDASILKKTMTIYDIPFVVIQSLSNALTPKNV
jgi:hypothetical protein